MNIWGVYVSCTSFPRHIAERTGSKKANITRITNAPNCQMPMIVVISGCTFVMVLYFVFVFVIVSCLTKSDLLTTLTKCLKGQKYLELLFEIFL